ncbi:uncharacterized protein LOC141899106 [Tubulanus polymorphus]|uniref:uncharacterized protein LOC141899106 n=1 Tax=Tubulanus polymorphus TaxID=672921 RepID=UPI003DA6AF06
MGIRQSSPNLMENEVDEGNSCNNPIETMASDVLRLHYAVMGNQREDILQCIEAKVDVNAPWQNPSNPSIKDGSTPLICAVSLNFVNVAKILLAAGAQVNLTDSFGNSPLYKAAFHGRPHLIQLLLDAGADVNLRNGLGQTPLSIAVQNYVIHNNTESMKLVTEGGLGLLHIAALYGKSPKVTEVMLSAHCNVDAVDDRGRTPLYVCMSTLSMAMYRDDLRLQLPCVRSLFRAGCDMLNFTEWTLWKGTGIPPDLCKDDQGDDDNAFMIWYIDQCNSPLTLKNLCRKTIQEVLLLNDHIGLPKVVKTFVIPHALQEYLSRKLCHGMKMDIDHIAGIACWNGSQ